MGTGKGTIEVDGEAESTPMRVSSPDGTEIAYWRTGEGPPLVLVHGASGDHTRWRPLLPYLEPHAAVYAIDRRGRGASGDGPEYRVAREFEDLAAVVDAVARASGSPVDVYGHSYGGLCAFGAAPLTSNIRRLVLYEGWPAVNAEAFVLPPGLLQRLDGLIARGDPETALQVFMREVVMLSQDEFESVRAQPSWSGRVAAAQTITREIRAYMETPFDPEQAARITVPTLLVTGSGSPDPAAAEIDAVAAALPDARIAVLQGQQHVADVFAPGEFAAPVVAFLREEA